MFCFDFTILGMKIGWFFFRFCKRLIYADILRKEDLL